MSLERIEWDEWERNRFVTLQTVALDWDQVKAAIQNLDANECAIASLIASQSRLMVGVGAGQFVMFAGLDAERHLTAEDERKPSSEIELAVGGQTGICDSGTVWNFETVLRTALVYWRDNALNPDVNWV